MNHKKLAMAAARRMKTTKRPTVTVKTWAKHMLALIEGAK